MNNYTKKIRSGKGASITFALLLFLVCAVVCSVVLAAATTASGRMAGIAETDQRYYSVTSACELVKDLVDSKSASVIQVEGKDSNGDPTSATYVCDIPAYEVTEDDLVTGAMVKSTEKFTSITQAAAYAYWKKEWGTPGDEKDSVYVGTFDLSSNLTKYGSDPLKATVRAEVEEDGSIVFNVQSLPDKRGNVLKQRMLFSGTVMDPDNTAVTQDGDIDVKKAITLTWTLTSVTAF